MSSILKNDYVGRVDLTDPNYPWGKGQNRLGSVPNTGTPFDEKWFNDFEGNKQAYLRLAGIVPSGAPDNAVESDQLEAIKRISNAFLVGNPAGSFRYGFDFTSANDVGIANDGTFWKYSGTDSYPVTVAEDTDPTAGDFTQAFARDGQPNPVGSFSDVGGVTFNFPNDVARDDNGEYWSWTESLPYTAAQNTVPSEPNYSKRLANVAENISNDDGTTAQDTYDALKATLVSQGLSGNFGFFTKGFTYNLVGDVGIDTDGKIYTYAGSDPLPINVEAGTNPTGDPDYLLQTFNRSPFSDTLTLAEAVSNKYLEEGDIITISDRNYGVFDVVSGVSANGFDVIQTQKPNLKLKLRLGMVIDMHQMGFKGNKVQDDTNVIQHVLDLFDNGTDPNGVDATGCIINFGKGVGRTTSPLHIKTKNIIMYASGNWNTNYIPDFSKPQDTHGTIFADHTGPAFILDCNFPIGGLSVSKMNFATNNTPTTRSSALFSFDIAGSERFQRDFSFHEISAVYFTKVFEFKDSVNTGSLNEFGVVSVTNCNIHQNTQILDTMTTPRRVVVNGLTFTGNEAGGNYAVTQGYTPDNVFYFDGAPLKIANNVLEGQKKLKLVNVNGLEVKSNYYEANTGDCVIDVIACRNYDIGSNHYRGPLITTDGVGAKISGCRQGSCTDPHTMIVNSWLNDGVLCDYQPLIVSDSVLSSFITPYNKSYERVIANKGTRKLTATNADSLVDPFDPSATVNGNFLTNGNSYLFSETTLAYSAGDILLITVPFMCEEDPNPVFVFTENTTIETPTPIQGGIPSGLKAGNWYLLTVAIIAKEDSAVSGSRHTLRFYPYGLSEPVKNWSFVNASSSVLDSDSSIRPFAHKIN